MAARDDIPWMQFIERPRGSSPGSLTARLVEHARVRLTSDVLEQGSLYPAGSTGTVVHVHRDGAAFEVEITHPGHDVITVEGKALELASQ
jgi:hypothetical protein